MLSARSPSCCPLAPAKKKKILLAKVRNLFSIVFDNLVMCIDYIQCLVMKRVAITNCVLSKDYGKRGNHLFLCLCTTYLRLYIQHKEMKRARDLFRLPLDPNTQRNFPY